MLLAKKRMQFGIFLMVVVQSFPKSSCERVYLALMYKLMKQNFEIVFYRFIFNVFFHFFQV